MSLTPYCQLLVTRFTIGNVRSTTETTGQANVVSVATCVKRSHVTLRTGCKVGAQALEFLRLRARRSCIFGTAAGSTRLSLQAASGHALPS